MCFFGKKAVGLDIADHTIEIGELVKKGSQIKFVNWGRVLLEPGIVKRGRIQDKERLSQAVLEVFSSAKPRPIKTKKVIFGLSEAQTYTQVVELPEHSQRERHELILSKARRVIPLEKDDLVCSYKILSETETGTEVFLVATSRQVILEWQDFFQELGITIEIFDIESLALFRGLFAKALKNPVCLVDIGAVSANIAIFDQAGLKFSQSVAIAGDVFTREISSALKISLAKAEETKIKLGLGDANSKTFSILVKALEPLVGEVKSSIVYFEEKTKQRVKEIILVGGSSRLDGLVDFFNTNLGLLTRLGRSSLLGKKVPLEFIEAGGLALRALDEKWQKRDPAFSLKKFKSSKKRFLKLYFSKLFRKEAHEPEENFKEIEMPAMGTKKRLLTLIIVLIVGLVFGGLGYWYRSNEQVAFKRKIQEQAIQYTKTQSFLVKVPVAISQAEYTTDRVKGRILEETIESAGDYHEAVAEARILAEKELKKGEKLWQEPISKLNDDQAAVFPITIVWLAFDEQDANKLLEAAVKKLNQQNVPFAINNIEKQVVSATENSSIYYLQARVTVALNQMIENVPVENQVQESSTSTESAVSVPDETIQATSTVTMVLIKETETGWLNVRTGPGTDFPIIMRVFPNQSYPLLEESQEWYKIEISESQSGWILAKYAQKQ